MNTSQLSTYQEKGIGNTPTLASAAAIFPQDFFNLISGGNDISTIVPPIAGYHLLGLVFTDPSPGQILDTGNILVAITPTSDALILLCYNPFAEKYYPTASTGGGGGGTPGSPTTSIQFNNSGSFGGSSNLEWINADNAISLKGAIRTGTTNLDTIALQARDVDGAAFLDFITLIAGNTPTLNIKAPVGGSTVIDCNQLRIGDQLFPTADGTANQVLTTDGSGNLFWDTGGGGGSPSGPDTSIQYNDSGSFNGSSSFELDVTNNILKIRNGPVSGINIDGTSGITSDQLFYSFQFGVGHSAYINWNGDGNNVYRFGLFAGDLNFAIRSFVNSKNFISYGGSAGTEDILKSDSPFQPAGYKSSDGTDGVTQGPFTTITSIEVKDGIVVGLSGS